MDCSCLQTYKVAMHDVLHLEPDGNIDSYMRFFCIALYRSIADNAMQCSNMQIHEACSR
jgi:hypothetical protein